jgi:hypothetical protein
MYNLIIVFRLTRLLFCMKIYQSRSVSALWILLLLFTIDNWSFGSAAFKLVPAVMMIMPSRLGKDLSAPGGGMCNESCSGLLGLKVQPRFSQPIAGHPPRLSL